MNEDIINVEILPDGTIKSTTPKISAANHGNASEFYKLLSRYALGAYSAVKRTKSATVTTEQKQTTGATN